VCVCVCVIQLSTRKRSRTTGQLVRYCSARWPGVLGDAVHQLTGRAIFSTQLNYKQKTFIFPCGEDRKPR